MGTDACCSSAILATACAAEKSKAAIRESRDTGGSRPIPLKNSRMHILRILVRVRCSRQFTRRIVAALVRTVLVARNRRLHGPPHPRRSDASAALEFFE